MTGERERDRRLALAVRAACLEELEDAFHQGGLSGLCLEGRWELALDRLRNLDLEAVLARSRESRPPD